MDPQIPTNLKHLQEDFEDFFENALCGFIIADSRGFILRANSKLTTWTNDTNENLKGKKFSDLLSIGGKIYYETHLWPLLRMQGFFDEVVLELRSPMGNKFRVMVNAVERRDNEGNACFIRYTILKATDRLQYEQNLQEAKKNAEKELIKQREMVILREQLIAVLGHDLRNPLSAVMMAGELLSLSSNDDNAIILTTLKRGTSRMMELVNNIMDFARTRLGEGIVLNRKDIMLVPVLQHVVDEMSIIHPKREIITSLDITGPVNCDSDRMAQLLSNLLANALTHGDTNFPVSVHGLYCKGNFELSVSNRGIPIPVGLHDQLFAPFTREVNRPSQHGLGLGLYIAAEIARAHNATLSFTSTVEETRFVFNMKL
jgi:sigma-B regulation protein RsbU (phosphoserine phosphatase)